MSLRDGTKKMSKSDPSDYSRINLTDDADTIAQKIRKAKTDPEPLPSRGRRALTARPEADNLVGIYAALTDVTPRPTCCASTAARSSPAFKAALVDSPSTKLAPIAAEMRRLMADPGHIDARPGRRRRRARASSRAPTMDAVKDIVGFVRASDRSTEPSDAGAALRALLCGQRPSQHAAGQGRVRERQAAILRGGPPAEIHGRRRRDARMRPGGPFRGPPRRAHRGQHDDAGRGRPAGQFRAGSASATR